MPKVFRITFNTVTTKKLRYAPASSVRGVQLIKLITSDIVIDIYQSNDIISINLD